MLLVAEIIGLSASVILFLFCVAVLVGCVVHEGMNNEKYHN